MLNRDAFEEWLEEHKDEAIGRIEGEKFTLRRWLSLLYQGLVLELNDNDSTVDETVDELVFDE